MRAHGARRLRSIEEQIRLAEARAARASAEVARLDELVQERRRELLAVQRSRARDRRLVAVGQLAAGVMHDVNNALSPIMSAAFLLQRHADDAAAVYAYAERIAKAADTAASAAARVARFLRDDGAGTHDERLDPVDLSAVIDDVLAISQPGWVERAHGASIALDRRLQDGVFTRGVPGELRGVVLNLVQNALDAMRGAGGTISVASGVDGHDAWVEVRDSGAGMSEEVRARAGEPFFTTKGAAGSGLGLSESRDVARRHGGSLHITSAPGRGTTVRLTLPACAPLVLDPSPTGAAPASTRRVLYVDAGSEGTSVVLDLLASRGHVVEHAVDGAAALARLGCDTPSTADVDMPYDVLVADLGVGDTDGWAVVSAARARWHSLRIGVVTGWELPARVGHAHAIDFMLRKPLRVNDLLSYVAARS
jgi:signal transduction histidine kinase/CheY-like chemotaxis protein